MGSFSKIMFVTFVVFMAISSSNGDLDTTPEHMLCNHETYKVGDYADNVAHVLEEMTTVTASCPDYSYSTQTTHPTDIVYGRSKCNSTLMVSDCVICMQFARASIEMCAGRIGAQVLLKDCFMRYEPYRF